MIVLPSARGRRFLVRLTKGEVVQDALRAIAREGDVACGRVTGAGTLVRAEVVDAGGLSWRVGKCTLLSLHAVIARRDRIATATLRGGVVPETEPVMYAGTLVDAVADEVELLVEALDDAALELGANGEWEVSEAVPVVAPQSASEASWAAAAATAERERPVPPSRRMEPAPVPQPLPEKRRDRVVQTVLADDPNEPEPEMGSWVRHRQFGLCQIEGEDPDGALVIRLPSGVRKSLSLDYMRVLPAEQDGDRVVYPLEPRKR